MKRTPYVLLFASMLAFSMGTPSARALSLWINELHYDNDGGDTGEFVEVAGQAGLDLSGFELALYNGNGGGVYKTEALSGLIPDQSNGFGAVGFDIAGIQNGAPDGLALVDVGGGAPAVLQFLSYEGTIAATDGPALGLDSTDIGVSQSGSTPVGASVGLVGSGAGPGDFDWESFGVNSKGALNAGQSFSLPSQPNSSSPVPDASATAGLLLPVLGLVLFARSRMRCG